MTPEAGIIDRPPQKETLAEDNPDQARSDEYHNQELFEEIEPSFIKMVEALKESIDSRRHQVLLSDDCGGRVITLALREIMKNRQGEAPETFFFPGGYSMQTSGVNEQMAKILESLEAKTAEGKKVLLVSEYVYYGDTITALTKLLAAKGIDVDVAVPVSRLTEDEMQEKIAAETKHDSAPLTNGNSDGEKQKRNIFFGKTRNGDDWDGPPQIDLKAESVSGVEKSVDNFLRPGLLNHEDLARARNDMKLMASRAVKQVWPE